MIALFVYMWHLYHLRMEANLRSQVNSILAEYVNADEYSLVEMEDRSSSGLNSRLLGRQEMMV
jgi:hypothetical protein